MSIFTYKKIVDLALDSFPKRGKLKVIDFGCGSGKLIEYFPTEKIKNYIGVDVNKDSLMKARSRYHYSKFIFRHIKKDEYSLGLNNSVDTVIAVGILQYLTDGQIEYFLSKTRQVLKTGGVLVLSCASDHLIYKIINIYRIFLPHRYINRDWLIQVLKKQGFIVTYQKESGLILNPLFSHNIVFFFDLFDKIFFRSKGNLGPLGKMSRSVFNSILYLENIVKIDFGYMLIMCSKKR